MADDKVVRAEQTSTEETTSKGTEEQSKEQPFNEEQEARMQQLMAQTASTAKEEGRREMQGIKDKEVATAQRRASQAEATVGAYQGKMSELDPEAAGALRAAGVEVKERYYQGRDAEEAQRGQQEAFARRANESLLTHLRDVGIDPDDKEIDWARDATDFVEGRSRFDASVAKILRGKTVAKEKELDTKFEDMRVQTRKDLGLDSPDTTTSAGIAKGVPTDMATLREKLSDRKWYEEHKEDIDEMMKKGLIK